MRISAILDHIGVRAQKPPKKGYFVDAKAVRKALKMFNLTTANAIVMKLTTIMYLHESVDRKAFRARNPFFSLIASLVRLFYKLDDIWDSMKNHPKWVQNDFYAKFSKIRTKQNYCLQELCNSIRSFIWHKTWGVN